MVTQSGTLARWLTLLRWHKAGAAALAARSPLARTPLAHPSFPKGFQKVPISRQRVPRRFPM
eukprot:6026260-Pyramimonas_sp.AAC.1